VNDFRIIESTILDKNTVSNVTPQTSNNVESGNSLADNSSNQTRDEHIVDQVYISQTKQDECFAKEKELEQWRLREVYKDIEDNGQNYISLRWVVTTKIIDNQPTKKARLCARGFEEDQNFRTDSPTCTREGIRIILSLIASRRWNLNSIDIKTAFLQGNKLERTVIVKPPREAKTEKLWLLKKCIYGLADASRYWYLKVKEELSKLGGKPSLLDQGIFYFYKANKLIGVILLFVDDLLWSGEQSFYETIRKIKTIFQIGTEHKEAFKYIGINMKQNEDKSITIDQISYADSIPTIALNKIDTSNNSRQLNKDELTVLRSSIGQLNWLANISRPEISFQVSTISSKMTTATVSEIKETNKLINFVKNNPIFIKFSPLHRESTHIIMYADASFNNLENGNSQGGHLVMIRDKNQVVCPIFWKSNKVRRVARSTLAAETLAFTDGTDSSYFISKLAIECGLVNPTNKIVAYTDNKSLFDSASTTSLVTDRRLRVEISAIRELKEKDEISIHWIPKENQLADCLTKKGASTTNLSRLLEKGTLNC